VSLPQQVAGRGPHVHFLPDTTILEESDSLFVGHMFDLQVSESAILVVDDFADHALLFDRRGRVIRRYGSRGEGPGELRNAGVGVLGDSVVYVSDEGSGQLVGFDRRSGALTGSLRYVGIAPRSYAVRGAGLVFGLINRATKTSLGILTEGADTLVYSFPLPAEFGQAAPLSGIFPKVVVAAGASGALAVGWQPLDRVAFLGGIERPHAELIQIPTRKRKGTPRNLVALLSNPSYPDIFHYGSLLVALHVLPDGSVLVVHEDLEGEPPNLESDVFFSIVRPDHSKACVDGALSLEPQAGRPLFAFRSDTIFVGIQAVDPRRGSVVTTVREAWIDVSDCTWLPTTVVSSHK
jgi:hypothetical protein